MSLKVTYKGTDIIDESASCVKKLDTQGKYLEDDVTIDYTAGGGTVGVEEKDVNFYDYDGTCLCSYTAQEAQQLTALPTTPIHEGLTFQEWNFTLAKIKEYASDIGQCVH